MASSIIPPKFRAFNDAGAPLAFGKVYTYQSGTNIPKATYTSEDGTVANTNPVILNANGYADIYLEGSYKIVVKDANDVEMWTADPVTSAENQGTEWVDHHVASKYSASQIKIADNVTDIFHYGRRIRIDAGNIYYGDIDGSYFNGTDTIVTVTLDTGATIADGTVSATVGIISSINSSQPSNVFLKSLKGNDSTAHLSYTATQSLKAKIAGMDAKSASNTNSVNQVSADLAEYESTANGRMTNIEQDVSANTAAISAGAGGIIGFATKADMDADLAHDENVLAQVVIDPTPGNNGLYIKVGASGAGSWSPSTYDRVQAIDDRVDVIEGEIELSVIYSDDSVSKFFPDSISELSQGAISGEKTIYDTFSGWKNPVTYGGESFDLVKVYLVIEAPADVTLVVEQDNQTPITSSTRKIYTSGWHFFKLPIVVGPGVVTGSVIHIGFTAGNETRMMPPITSFNANHPDFGVYDVYYTTNLGPEPRPWQKVTESGENAWPIAFRLFDTSNATLVSDSTLEDDFYSVIQVLDKLSYDSSTAAFRLTDSAKPGNRDSEFAGWGAVYNRVAGKSFNMIKIPVLTVSVDPGDTDLRWSSIVLEVTSGAIGGSVLARSEISIDGSSNELLDLEFLLKDPINGNVITLDENNLPSQYGIRYLAYNRSGQKAVSSEVRGTVSNFAGLSYYQTIAGSSWATFTGNPGLAFESYLVVNPTEYKEYVVSANSTGGNQETAQTELVATKNVYAVDGHEANIYFDNLTYNRYQDFLWNVVCNVGKHQNERFTFNSGSPGVYAMSISAHNPYTHTELSSWSGSFKVASALAGGGKNPKCLFIGDSTTARGVYTGELVSLFGADAMDITLIGTVNSGTGNYHEGRGGWTVNRYYATEESPFVFSGNFDFSQYMSTNGFTGVDWVFFHLGINDVFGQLTDAGAISVANNALLQLEAMIADIKSYDPTVKFGILIAIPPSTDQDSFGDDYGCGQTQWRYKRNITLWNKVMIQAFEDREAENIYAVGFNLNVDAKYNMPSSQVAVNSRNSELISRQNDSVHPSGPGFYQMADGIFAFLKYLEQ